MQISTGFDFWPVRRKASLLMNKVSSIVLAVTAAVALLSSKPLSAADPASTPKPTTAPSSTAQRGLSGRKQRPPIAAAAANHPRTAVRRTCNLKDPVATVNGDKISKAQLDEAFDKAVEMTGVKASDLTPEQKLEGYRQILDELITEKLVNKAAAGITVPQADVDAQIAEDQGPIPVG